MTFNLSVSHADADATKACAEGTYEAKATAKTINAGAVVRFPETTNTSAWTYGKWVDMGSAGRWATGLTMFLPAVGYANNQNLSKGRPDGCYWTSTHRYNGEVNTNVFAISFTFCDGDRFVTAEFRSFGLFVRAVKD